MLKGRNEKGSEKRLQLGTEDLAESRNHKCVREPIDEEHTRILQILYVDEALRPSSSTEPSSNALGVIWNLYPYLV